jgi:EAL domain-containing protein (putative c-di-GMP-specific phosphodiesterase class I)
MYSAKSLGRNRYCFFTPALQEAAENRLYLANDLRRALPEGQFWLAYQPIVELASGAIYKAEALLRWQHPKRGLVSPAEFIPIAEETGLILEIGNWVFQQAVQQVRHWRHSLHTDIQISVNASPVQFKASPGCHSLWSSQPEPSTLDGKSIVIEITEGILMDASSEIVDKLIAFRDAGMQVALDDFGTGYSSLSYLKKFDIDYLKIDQSFVKNLEPQSDDLILCQAIIVMAHKLGIQVIAEGIETQQQLDLLRNAGCDYGQGYLFSRPVPAAEFERLFE